MKPILRSLINQAIRAKSILQTGRAFHATIALKGSKVNYSPDELVSLIYMFKSILDTSLLMLVKSLVGLSSLISAPCL